MTMEAGKDDLLSDLDLVRLTWVDLAGRGRGKTLPGAVYRARRDGGSGLTGCRDALSGTTPDQTSRSVLLQPDPASLHALPWASTPSYKVGQVFCDSRHPAHKQPLNNCCRTLAKEQLAKLDDLGYELLCGYELEFSLVHTENKLPVFAAETGGSYMSQELFTQHQDFFVRLGADLGQAGVRLETMHTEVCAGQFEITFEPSVNLWGADVAFLAQSAIHTLSGQYGMMAHFDAVLQDGESGNAAHFNTSLLRKGSGERVFWDSGQPDHLSEEARHWMAGILRHVPALTALCAPYEDCYRRYHTTWNPQVADWDLDNSMCTLRTKNWSPALCYVENRLPSGRSNPYLVLAGTVAAGLDGLLHRLPCPPPAQHMAPAVPATLEQALAALQEDQVLIKALGEEFVNHYIEHSVRENHLKC